LTPLVNAPVRGERKRMRRNDRASSQDLVHFGIELFCHGGVEDLQRSLP
jgi:hypothetical protein